MEIQSDFKELLELFNSHKVEYLIAGAYALAYQNRRYSEQSADEVSKTLQ